MMCYKRAKRLTKSSSYEGETINLQEANVAKIKGRIDELTVGIKSGRKTIITTKK